MNSSYYTGYEDLDKKLRNLYDAQTEIERKQCNGTVTEEDNRRYQAIIHRQDWLLKQGTLRGEKNDE